MKKELTFILICFVLVGSMTLVSAESIKATMRVIGGGEEDLTINLGCDAGDTRAKEYCSLDNGWISQKLEAETCAENYECESGLCEETLCTGVIEETGLFQKIINWFKGIFS